MRERAVRMVLESADGYGSRQEAIRETARMLGIGSPETLRRWLLRAEVDAGIRAGVSTAESEEVKRLRREVVELRRANQILKSASAFFAAELDRPPRH